MPVVAAVGVGHRERGERGLHRRVSLAADALLAAQLGQQHMALPASAGPGSLASWRGGGDPASGSSGSSPRFGGCPTGTISQPISKGPTRE